MRASTFLLFLAAVLAVIVSTAPSSDAALAMADGEASKSDNRLSLSPRQDNDVRTNGPENPETGIEI
jgi:hypothetical protein